MNEQDARDLLAKIGVIGNRCDLDLLIFFIRHPRALLTSEQLARWIGRAANEIAQSLDVLVGAGLVRRAQNPAHAARLFVLDAIEPDSGWVAPLRQGASTREGRLALIRALTSAGKGDPAAMAGASRPRGRRRRFSVVGAMRSVPRTG